MRRAERSAANKAAWWANIDPSVATQWEAERSRLAAEREAQEGADRVNRVRAIERTIPRRLRESAS